MPPARESGATAQEEVEECSTRVTQAEHGAGTARAKHARAEHTSRQADVFGGVSWDTYPPPCNPQQPSKLAKPWVKLPLPRQVKKAVVKKAVGRDSAKVGTLPAGASVTALEVVGNRVRVQSARCTVHAAHMDYRPT